MKKYQNRSRKISIALGTYNGERFLSKQIESLLAQTRLPDELVISDDCSTDGTLTVVKSLTIPGTITLRILQNQSRIGFIKNFERAINECTGDVIFLCDQDDIWHIDKIAKMMDGIGNALLVHSDARLVDEDGRVLADSYSYSKKKHPENASFGRLIDDNCVTGCTTMIRHELLEMAFPFPEEIPHDQWLALLASDKRRLAYIPEALVDYRQHSRNVKGAGKDADTDNFFLGSSGKIDRHKHAKKAVQLRALYDRANEALSPSSNTLISDLIQYHEYFSTKHLNIRGMLIHLKHFDTINFRDPIIRRLIKLLLTPYLGMI